MGAYMNSEKELYQELRLCLDEIEGDFTKESLNKVLEKLKSYEHTCD